MQEFAQSIYSIRSFVVLDLVGEFVLDSFFH